MRRLAKQSREDKVSSQRDYQQLFEERGHRIEAQGDVDQVLRLSARIDESTNTDLVAFGGFVFPSAETTLGAVLLAGGHQVSGEFRLASRWNRIGLIEAAPDSESIDVELRWDDEADLTVWGLAAGAVHLPAALAEQKPQAADLEPSHLAPETFYLPHVGAFGLDIDAEQSTRLHLDSGELITLKKCAYCGRLLPVNMDRPGSMSFHKHNDKVSNHQNECRACKKWRINDSFNPKRTVDQLHESSVITRERRLFLRDPEILQQIKDRTGAGLKSQIWERFGRCCFYCRGSLTLEEVELDHTRPLAYLWPIDEHATCLCTSHNNQKREKFPVDFYTDDQLHELSAICGLPYEELREKKLNEVELDRILGDIAGFARQWEPRTFAATARKVLELRPDVSLYEELERADPELYAELMAQLQERPPSVGEE